MGTEILWGFTSCISVGMGLIEIQSARKPCRLLLALDVARCVHRATLLQNVGNFLPHSSAVFVICVFMLKTIQSQLTL